MEGWTTIRYLHAQNKSIRAICKELGVTRKVVRRALRAEQPPHYQRPKRANPQLAPYEGNIREMYFSQHFIGSRIIRELRKLGYQGGTTAVYSYLHGLRQPQLASKVTMRFETEPGQQGQYDWSPYTVELGGSLKRLVVYCLTLGFSRRKHYTASFDERQPSVYEGIEEGLWHFAGAPKELLVDNARAFVVDASAEHFRWNAQFLELCGHYRMQPRACQPYRARTKGKVERPFFFLEQHLIKGGSWRDLDHFLEDLARFEREELDVAIHSTTRERPIDRFAREQPLLTPLPAKRFVGTLTLTREVSWDCLLSYEGNRYSVPAAYAGKLVWLLVSRGCRLLVLNSRRELLVDHELSQGHGEIIMLPEHYEPLRRRGNPRTYALLAERFLSCFPHHAEFLEGLTAQYKVAPGRPLRQILELASLYDDPTMAWAFGLGVEYNTYSPVFIRGLLESRAQPQLAAVTPLAPATAVLPATGVHGNLAAYQRVLEFES